MDSPPNINTAPVSPDSQIEDLGLSVRASNALRAAGCRTVRDVLRLDIGAPVRGLGPKARDEVFGKLAEAGFSQASDRWRASDIALLARSLERIQQRLDGALGSVAKELRSARLRLRRLQGFPPGSRRANGEGPL